MPYNMDYPLPDVVFVTRQGECVAQTHWSEYEPMGVEDALLLARNEGFQPVGPGPGQIKLITWNYAGRECAAWSVEVY